MLKIGSKYANRYEILKQIGKGGFSTVYLAMDTRLNNRQWAIKEVVKSGYNKDKKESIEASVMAETDIIKKLDHPALPRITDIINNEDAGTLCIVMDYIEGDNLGSVLKHEGPQSEEDVIKWALQIADVLSYLHRQDPPIIYRDLKPQNIMLKPDGNIKIIDFGIAREYKEDGLKDTTVLGTKGFASPEAYIGQTDARSDIFSLGVTMHNLLTGWDPRDGSSYAPVRNYRPELSKGVEYIINRCVEPAAERRYQDCTELIYDLQDPTRPIADTRRKQKGKLAAFLTAGILSILLAISGLVCNVVGTNMNNNSYGSLINVNSSMNLEDKLENCQKAMAIYPGDPRAYIVFLQAYEEEGYFDKNGSDIFTFNYERNKENFDKSTKEYAELNYLAGTMYFSYYNAGNTNTVGGNEGYSSNVVKAYSYFRNNFENANISSEFADQSLSNCYYRICDFSRRFTLSQTRSPSREDYNELLLNIDLLMENVNGASEYNQLALYNTLFFMLHSEAKDFANMSVDMGTVLGAFDEICRRAKNLNASKAWAEKLKSEIVQYENAYRADIENAYEANSKFNGEG